MLNRLFARYTFAVAAVAMAFVWRLAMVSVLHAELPTYLTFYPAVMLVALLAGQWAGLVATALSALVVDYWILPPVEACRRDRSGSVQPHGRIHVRRRRALPP